MDISKVEKENNKASQCDFESASQSSIHPHLLPMNTGHDFSPRMPSPIPLFRQGHLNSVHSGDPSNRHEIAHEILNCTTIAMAPGYNGTLRVSQSRRGAILQSSEQQDISLTPRSCIECKCLRWHASKALNLAAGGLMIAGGVINSMSNDTRSIVLGVIIIFFGVITLSFEIHVPLSLALYSRFLFTWCGRGILYIFVGALLILQWWPVLIFAIILISIGLIYCVCGIFGLPAPPNMEITNEENY